MSDLVDQAFYDRGATRVTVGLSLITPVCDICGAVLADQQRHDEWHERIESEDE